MTVPLYARGTQMFGGELAISVYDNLPHVVVTRVWDTDVENTKFASKWVRQSVCPKLAEFM